MGQVAENRIIQYPSATVEQNFSVQVIYECIRKTLASDNFFLNLFLLQLNS